MASSGACAGHLLPRPASYRCGNTTEAVYYTVRTVADVSKNAPSSANIMHTCHAAASTHSPLGVLVTELAYFW